MEGLPWKTRLAAQASRPAGSQFISELRTSIFGIMRNESSEVSCQDECRAHGVEWMTTSERLDFQGVVVRAGWITTVETLLLAGTKEIKNYQSMALALW